jgi:tRNA pseudouridine55 synthase
LIDGILNINKPSGMTSHDVVQIARRLLGEKRIGHTGTLDPLATGVLILCIGKATRIAQYLEAGEKEYRAIMRLGVTTDTLDAAGRILETRTYEKPDRRTLLRVMQQFTGTIMQSPPAFSAVKISGVPSYKLARQGKAIQNKPRPATIYGIELTAFEDPLVSLTVRCSKGVYIRSLCAEMGNALYAGAHLAGLQRTRSGSFSINAAVTIETLARMAENGTVADVVTSIDDALAEFPVVELGTAESGRVMHGNKVDCPGADKGLNAWRGLVRVHDSVGRFLALARYDGATISPELVFSCNA